MQIESLIKSAEERELLAEEISGEEKKKLLLEAAEIYITVSKLCSQKQAQSFVRRAKECYIKSQKKEDKSVIKPLVIEEKKISFNDIAGLEKVKEKIRLKIIEPFKHPELYAYFGKKVGGGILMYGPPGCGKTLFAEAAASEAGCAFFNVSLSEINSKYVGETEKNISALFAKARESAPSIIFFDELEALGGERSNSTPYAKNAVSHLLTEINGIGNKDQRILLIGATNEPWNVDIALRRAGRFGDPIFIPPPDFKTRYKLIKNYLKNKPIANDVNVIALSIETEGYSGAELVALCDDAIELALMDSISTKKKREITMDDFIKSLEGKKYISTNWFKMAVKELKKNEDETMLKEIIEFSERFGYSSESTVYS